ncbi:MAG TPA: hypothetical protein VKU41_19100 [Polyangiaceae bacterium]|nr:hypothetical protein [Polyangiaceae bacterium]
MDLRIDARIPYPRDVVFAASRDDIVRLKEYLTDIRSIEVTSRAERGPLVDLAIDWRGGAEIPGPLRTVLGESSFSWTDYSTWNADELWCDWRTVPHSLTEAVRCEARDVFLEDGPGKTLMQLRGRLDVDGAKIRGVPSFLAGPIGRAMESFLVRKTQSGVLETAAALTKYLGAATPLRK